MKRKLMTFAIISLIILLSSCSLWNVIMGTHIASAKMGTLLPVDADGHFTEDITYDTGSTKISYSTAGQYESLSYSYSSTTNTYILSSGFRAAYSWDTETMLLTKTYTAEYNSTTEVWDPLTRSLSYTIYFSTQNYGDSFLKQTETTDETWKYDYSVTYDDSSTITIYKQWVFSGTTMTYTYRRINKNSSGVTTSGWDEERVYTVTEKYPAGTEWGEGNSITFNTDRTSGRTRSWDTGINSWDSWSAMTQTSVLLPLSHAGSYIFESQISSTRDVEVEFFEEADYEG